LRHASSCRDSNRSVSHFEFITLLPPSSPRAGLADLYQVLGVVFKMFNTSLRRAARSCPRQSLTPSRSSTPIAPFTSRSHQRRHSSSKPPVPPNNGSPAIPASAVKQVGAARSETKKPAADAKSSKRKAQKAVEPQIEALQDNWAATLPSVPSTQGMNQKGMTRAAPS
jgi:hypothetical protein